MWHSETRNLLLLMLYHAMIIYPIFLDNLGVLFFFFTCNSVKLLFKINNSWEDRFGSFSFKVVLKQPQWVFFVSLFVCLVIFFGLVGWLVCSLDYFVWVGEGGGYYFIFMVYSWISYHQKRTGKGICKHQPYIRRAYAEGRITQFLYAWLK